MSCFYGPDCRELGQAIIGGPTKVAKLARLNSVSFGYPVDSLAMRRPDLMVGSTSHSHSPAPEEDRDDDASDGNVDFSFYLTKMKRTIQAKWKVPSGLDQRKIVTTFEIMQDGSIVKASVVQGSGDDQVDKTALEALAAASPLDPLPAGAPKSVQMRYVFDWHIKH